MLSISLFVSIDLLCDDHQHLFPFPSLISHFQSSNCVSFCSKITNSILFNLHFDVLQKCHRLESCDHFIFNHSYSMYLFHCFFCISCSIESDLLWKHWLHLFGEFQFLSHQVLNISSDVQYLVLSDSLDQFHWMRLSNDLVCLCSFCPFVFSLKMHQWYLFWYF